MIDICENKHGGNAQSAEAYLSTDREHLRRLVYEHIVFCGATGATADEVVTHFKMFHNSLAPRLSELKRSELIIASGELRKTRLGRSAAVYVAQNGG